MAELFNIAHPRRAGKRMSKAALVGGLFHFKLGHRSMSPVGTNRTSRDVRYPVAIGG
jgi:hypothetical protein